MLLGELRHRRCEDKLGGGIYNGHVLLNDCKGQVQKYYFAHLTSFKGLMQLVLPRPRVD